MTKRRKKGPVVAREQFGSELIYDTEGDVVGVADYPFPVTQRPRPARKPSGQTWSAFEAGSGRPIQVPFPSHGHLRV